MRNAQWEEAVVAVELSADGSAKIDGGRECGRRSFSFHSVRCRVHTAGDSVYGLLVKGNVGIAMEHVFFFRLSRVRYITFWNFIKNCI
jgi:hypothetical protein